MKKKLIISKIKLNKTIYNKEHLNWIDKFILKEINSIDKLEKISKRLSLLNNKISSIDSSKSKDLQLLINYIILKIDYSLYTNKQWKIDTISDKIISHCKTYECLNKWIESNTNTQWLIPININILNQTVHTSSNISVDFEGNNIKYQSRVKQNNLNDNDALIKLRTFLNMIETEYNTTYSENKIKDTLEKSKEIAKKMEWTTIECDITITDKGLLLDLFKKWGTDSFSTNDFNFADCTVEIDGIKYNVDK
jgi:hypothetical protein